MTTEGKMIVSYIGSMKKQDSYSVIIQVVRGKDSDYIRYCDYNQLSTHGIMKNYTTSDLSHLMDELRFKGFLNEHDEILISDVSVKELLNNQISIYTTQ